MAGSIDCIYWRGLLQLPSDFDRAMREASKRRTVTDTDSYAFSFINQPRQREDDHGICSIMCNPYHIKLYKYYAFTEYNIDALKKGYWYFSTPDYRNDPFDCCIEIYKRIISRDLNEQETEWLKKFGACCFTKSSNNILLWSLYADSHKGFVLEFEFTEDDYINMTTGRRLNLPLFDMIYSETIPTKDEIDFNELQSKQYFAVELNEMPPDRLMQEHRKLLWYLAHSLKQKSFWKTEDEVRMLLGTMRPDKDIPGAFETLLDGEKTRGYKVYYPKHCLKKCIAGLSISYENKEALESITKRLGIPLTHMEIGNPFNLIEQTI